MFLTRESDYALRILRALHRKGQLSARSIAEMEKLPLPVTYKTLEHLIRSGLVGSQRGPEGGYYLARACEELTLYDLLQAMEADLLVNRCMERNYRCETCPDGMEACGLHRECCRIQAVLETELQRRPLSEILE